MPTPINLDAYHTVKFPENFIHEATFKNVYDFLQDTGEMDLAGGLTRLFVWDDETSEWRLWSISSKKDSPLGLTGTWPKRFAKVMYKAGHKVDPKVLAVIGEKIARGTKGSETYHFSFSKFVDWEHGDYGEVSGGCWHGGPSNLARIGLVEDPQGYAILFYSSKAQFAKMHKKKGKGRCWMYVTPRGPVIFNAYGVSLLHAARVLAQHWGLSYKRITIKATDGIYINAGNMNNDGATGGRAGVGYLIASVDVCEAAKVAELPDFRHRDGICHICEKPDFLSDMLRVRYDNGDKHTLCSSCLDNYACKCANCEVRTLVSMTVEAHMRGRVVRVCTFCVPELSTCSFCGLTLDPVNHIWHNTKKVCSYCTTREKVAFSCYGCGRIVQAGIGYDLRLRKFRLCTTCSKKAHPFQPKPQEARHE